MTKLDKRNPNNLFEARDLLFIWNLVLKNIGILIIFPSIAFLVGYVYAHRLNNIFGAKSQLLLKSNETYDYQDPIYQGLGAYAVYTDVQNQMRIIKSRNLIGEVIDKIDINTSYYFVGRLKRVEVFGTLPFFCDVTVRDKSLYEVPIKIQILDHESYKMSFELGGEDRTHTYKFNEEYTTDDFIIRLSKAYDFFESSSVITDSDYELVFHSREFLISKYQSKLDVVNIDFTSIVEVTIADEIEERAMVFLDTLTSTYIDYSKRVQLEVNQNTLDNIQKQIDTARSFIEAQELNLLTYRDQNKILDLTREEEQYFSEYVFYTKQLRVLEEQKSSLISLEEYLKNSVDDRTLPPYFYIEQSDMYLSEAIKKLREKQMSLEFKQLHESKENPNYLNARKEVNLIENDIRSYIQNLKSAITTEIKLTNSYIDDYQRDIKDLPKSAQDILNIQRELDVTNKMYLFLLEKKTNTLIARAGIIPQVRVIEETSSLGLIEPDKNRIRIMFTLAGLSLALLIAVVRKLFFEKIENVSDLESITNMTIIGGIPFVEGTHSTGRIIDIQPKSQVTESFRTIRTHLTYLGKNEKGKGKKILVSSYFPGEGKTFCSTNLAELISKGDKKVIVLDFDLHKPRIHKAFDLGNLKGVSSLLINQHTIEECLQVVSPTLHLISAGVIPPNPSELILKEKVVELISWAENTYDFVIIDTPPFGLLHDAIELLKHADIFIVVLNTRFARKNGVVAIEQLLEDHTNVSKAVILNGIKQSRIKYYYSKYTYKYSYGKYGYGYGGYGQGYSD